MKPKRILNKYPLLLLSILLCCCRKALPDTQVVASVNGFPITISDLKEKLNYIPSTAKSQFTSPAGIRTLLDAVIAQKVELIEAKKSPSYLKEVKTGKTIDDDLIRRRFMAHLINVEMTPSKDEIVYQVAIHPEKYKPIPSKQQLNEISTKLRTEKLRAWQLKELRSAKVEIDAQTLSNVRL